MRIALVTTSYPLGDLASDLALGDDDPAGHFVRAETRALRREGHIVTVIAPTVTPQGAFGWPGVAARVRERPLRLLDAARWVAWARRELRRMGPFQRIVAHWAVPSAVPIALGAPPSSELEVVSHGGDVRLLAALPGPARTAVVRCIALRATSWRFVSNALLASLVGRLARPDAEHVMRVARVRPPDIDLYDAGADVRARRDALAGLPFSVVVARLVASKRVERAIEQVARGLAPQPLVVVGDGPERGRLEKLARARAVDARFVGKVGRRDALAWIGAADVLLHASHAEGLSTVVREATALGTRVEYVD